MSKTVIEIPKDEFEALIQKLKICEENNKKLQEALKFLNDQIDDFNNKFGQIKKERNEG